MSFDTFVCSPVRRWLPGFLQALMVVFLVSLAWARSVYFIIISIQGVRRGIII